jgi:hypothetical protein
MAVAIRILGLLPLLAACSPDPDAVGRPMTLAQSPGPTYLVPGDTCGASRLQDLVGQDAAALNAAPLPADYRVVYPDMPGGGAFQSNRLTATIDANNVIARVTCG